MGNSGMRTSLFEKEIRLFGLKRSGNNALIIYMAGHFNYKTNFIIMSNTDFNFRSRTGTGGPFEFVNKVYLLEKKAPKISKYFMMTTENYDLAEIGRKDKDGKNDFNRDRRWYARLYGMDSFAKETLGIMLLRSPHNNLASIIEKGLISLFPDFASMWVMYAKEAIGETNYINKKVPCLFDKWFSSVEYRKELCCNLGLDHNDRFLNRMRSWRKSSFDGGKYKKEAQKMKVLDRWKLYRKNKVYLDILRNDELIDLTERLFGYNLREILDL